MERHIDTINELMCPQCKLCYNINTRLPLVLPDTLGNMCKCCYVNATRCNSNNNNTPLVNETLLELIKYLNNVNNNNNNNNNNQLIQYKDKEDKLISKIEFVHEYITIITDRYNEFNDNYFKFQQALQSNINIKEYKTKLFKKLPKFLSEINKHYSAVKPLLTKIHQYTKDTIEEYNTWKELIMTYIDQLTLCLNSTSNTVNAVNSIDILSIEKAITIQSNKLITTFTTYDTVIDLLPQMKSVSQSKNSSFYSVKHDDISFNSHLPSSRPSITSLTSFTLDNTKSPPEMALTKDTVVFIKNKLKQPILNCSGYIIGDEGCRMILKLTLQSIFNNKHNVDKKQHETLITYSELKLSKCAISDNGICYLNMFMNVTNNTISIVNLSHNLISNKAENDICRLIKNNARNLRMLILSDNLLNVNVAEKIIKYGKGVSSKLKIDI
jgi:hypothetical protein